MFNCLCYYIFIWGPLTDPRGRYAQFILPRAGAWAYRNHKLD
jgi:hypothetical protein